MPRICAFCQCPLVSWHLAVRTSPRTPISLHVCWYDPGGADCASPALAPTNTNIKAPIAKLIIRPIFCSLQVRRFLRTCPDIDLDSPQRNPGCDKIPRQRCRLGQYSYKHVGPTKYERIHAKSVNKC